MKVTPYVDLAEVLLKHHPDLPIVVCTGFFDTVPEWLRWFAAACVEKRDGLDVLLSAIQKMIAHKKVWNGSGFTVRDMQNVGFYVTNTENLYGIQCVGCAATSFNEYAVQAMDGAMHDLGNIGSGWWRSADTSVFLVAPACALILANGAYWHVEESGGQG